MTVAPTLQWKSVARTQIPLTLRMAFPLVLGQMGQMAMILIDTFMVGKLGPEAIGGVGLGSAFFYIFTLFGAGVLFGLDYLVANAEGRKAVEECHHWLWQGLYLSLILSLPVIFLIEWTAPWVLGTYFPANLGVPALAFLKALSPSLLPFLVFVSFRQYLQATGSVRASTVITLFAILSNITFNQALIFGRWGAPTLGVAGAGWATTTTRTLMAVTIAFYAFHRDRKLGLGLAASAKHFEPESFSRLLRLGIPIGLQLALEFAVFALAAAFISRLGVVSAASHTIVSNIAGFTYMIPLGISGATAVLVGRHAGSKNTRSAQITGWTSIGLAIAAMAFSSLLLSVFGRDIAALVTSDFQVIRLSGRLLLLVSLFQVADAVQAAGGGALRGLGDTRSSMVANILGYWLIGLPVGYWCCFQLGLGAIGFWIGLTVGLFSVAAVVLRQWSVKSAAFAPP